ncbi:hypothetical protein NP493_1352g00000 [Ridgeia piscesae]|uniref:Uncharacterized protein n=1 Tax=Ridgeia piscesae TaxID=27915 RepID=A0AAD9K736_RIDPI|nr:hypothetical protein NP493_1352g00000 [Ridgeia piscesae]
MKWRDPSSGEDIKAKDESSNETVKFSIVVEMTPSHNGDSFTCQTYFDKPQSRDHNADNIPINNNVFNERFTLPKQNVYYEPRLLAVKFNVCAHTSGENVVVGEVMTVTADSNPATRNYTWKNTTSNEIIEKGESITITVRMLGSQSLEVLQHHPISIPTHCLQQHPSECCSDK